MFLKSCTVDPPPPNTAALGTGQKTAILENGCKGSHIYNQDKTYSGLENQQRYWSIGGGGQPMGGIGGG